MIAHVRVGKRAGSCAVDPLLASGGWSVESDLMVTGIGEDQFPIVIGTREGGKKERADATFCGAFSFFFLR